MQPVSDALMLHPAPRFTVIHVLGRLTRASHTFGGLTSASRDFINTEVHFFEARIWE